MALALAPVVAHYTATDQEYVLKILRQNISENSPHTSQQSRSRKSKPHSKSKKAEQSEPDGNITVQALDWETTQSSSVLPSNGVDMIIACDCIYNEALITPFVTTCADICALRAEGKPTICVVAQQLRSSDVFELWLKTFWEHFDVWSAPQEVLPEGLRNSDGFAIHLGLLKSRQRT